MAQDISMMILMQATDQASNVIKNVGAAFGPVGSALASATNALISFGQQSTQVATQYDQSQRMIQSLTGATNDQMKQYDQGVKQLASDTGVASTELSGGLYNMISAGYSGSDALKMLTLSTKDSVIGMTNATVTSNALTTVMRGFSVDIKYADSVNGQMIRTVTAGKMTMQDYAGAVAKTSSTAVQFHDTMVDMNSVLATLTSNGVKSAAIAGTDYDNLLKVLNGDTQKVAQKAKGLNSSFDEQAFAAMSVADKVKYLNSMIVEHGHQINEVMGKQQNAEAAFTILANNAKMYGDNLKNLGDATSNANATQAAWAITQQGFQVSMNRVNAAVQNVMITVGSAFLPVLSQLMTAVAGIVTGFTNWIQQTDILQNVANGLSAVFTQVSTVVQGVVSSIQNGFLNLPSQANVWGANMMDGFISGVESMVGVLVTMLDNVANEIANFIGFASPTKKGKGRNLMSWGPSMIQSFAQGIVSSGSSVQDAVSQIAQIASDGLQGVNASSAGASASSSFVSIGSGLQTVNLGGPLGQRGGMGSGGGAKSSNPLTTASASIATSTSKHAASVAASLAKHAAALAKHTAAAAAATKHAATVAKQQQAASVADTKLAAQLQKALTDSNTPTVQALVNQAKAAQASGNMALAKYDASQASKLAAQEKLATKQASAKQIADAKKAAAAVKHNQAAMAQAATLNNKLQKAITDSNTPAVQALVNQAKAAQQSGDTAMAKVYATEALTLAEQQKAAAKVKGGKSGAGGLSLPTGAGATAAQNGLTALTNSLSPVQNSIQSVNNGLKSVPSTANTVSHAVSSGFKSAMAGVKPAIDGAFGAIKTIIGSLTPMIKPTLSILIQVFSGLWSTIKTIGGVLGTVLLPALANLTSAIAPIIANLLRWVASSGSLKIAFAALGVVIKVVAATIGFIINVVAALIKFFTQTQLGIAIFQAVLVLLGLLAVAIGVIATVILVTMIPAFMAWLASAIAVGIANVIAFAPIVLIVLAVIAVITAVILIVKNWGAIAKWLQSAWGATVNFFKGMWDGIVKVFSGMGQWFKNRFTEAGNNAKAGGKNIAQGFQDFATKSADSMKWLYNHNYYVKDAVDQSSKWTKAATDWMAKAWKDTVNLSLQIWDGLKIGAARTWKQLSDVITIAVNAVTAWVTSAWNTATKWLQTQWNALAAFATMAWKAVSTVFSQIWTNYVSQPLTSLWNNVSTWFASLGNFALQSGKNFCQMLANGIASGVGWISNAVTGIANTIWKTLGFHSPTKEGPGKDADKWMPNLIKMMSKDLDDGQKDMAKSAKNVAGAIAGALSNPASIAAAIIHTAAGVALPNYDAGTGQTIADRQPVLATSSAGSSNALAGRDMHIHVHLGDSDGDARQHGQKVAEAVKKEMAKMLRGQAIAPRYTSGGR